MSHDEVSGFDGKRSVEPGSPGEIASEVMATLSTALPISLAIDRLAR